MLRLATDENFDGDVLGGLLRDLPDLDVLRVQDTELKSAEDPTVLEWTAQEQRVLLTHDARTMTKYAYDRVREGKPMCGVIEIPRDTPIGLAIEHLSLAVQIYTLEDLADKVIYLPLR